MLQSMTLAMTKRDQSISTIPKTRLEPLTVLHVVEGCQGGVGSAVRHLIDAQSVDPGVREVHLAVDPRRLGDMLHHAPAVTHEYESTRNPFHILQAARKLQRLIRSIAPDVVYLHSTFPGLYGRLAWKKPWATVYCAHGWSFTQKLPPLQRAIYAWIERALAYRTEAIVSISYSEFDAAMKANVRPALHRVIYHGLPGPRRSGSAGVAVDPSRLNLAFIGRFDRQKGLDLLLRVFADPQLNHITLWLIGDSTLGEKYSIPDQPNVQLIGWVPNSQIDDYIQCFDALIVPSRWEGFGLIALEAMRNGKAVLASRTGGLAELVIEGVNGRLFQADDPDDLKRMLLELSKDELGRMGKMAVDIFHTGFELSGCYSRWQKLSHEALALRPQAVQSKIAASQRASATIQPIEEL
jgi:glycosyltransferase involved in cell wall biosynthesis